MNGVKTGLNVVGVEVRNLVARALLSEVVLNELLAVFRRMFIQILNRTSFRLVFGR